MLCYFLHIYSLILIHIYLYGVTKSALKRFFKYIHLHYNYSSSCFVWILFITHIEFVKLIGRLMIFYSISYFCNGPFWIWFFWKSQFMTFFHWAANEFNTLVAPGIWTKWKHSYARIIQIIYDCLLSWRSSGMFACVQHYSMMCLDDFFFHIYSLLSSHNLWLRVDITMCWLHIYELVYFLTSSVNEIFIALFILFDLLILQRSHIQGNRSLNL